MQAKPENLLTGLLCCFFQKRERHKYLFMCQSQYQNVSNLKYVSKSERDRDYVKKTCCERDLELQWAILINCSSISKTILSHRTWLLFCEIKFQAFLPSSINVLAIIIWFLRQKIKNKK